MAKKKNSNIIYVEPMDYFPKELRKKYKLGEYAEDDEDETEGKEENKKNK